MDINVATFNILNTSCRYEERKEVLKKVIDGLKCEIVCLQEVNFERNSEVFDLENFEFVGGLLPLPMLTKEPEFRIDGNGMLVNKSIEVLKRFCFVYESNKRIAQFVKLRKEGFEFIVANTHLDHLSEAVRRSQTEELLGFCKDFSEFPLICTGDFNYNSDSEIYKLMSRNFASAHYSVHKKEPILTFPTGLIGNYHDPDEYGCFDYIWTTGKAKSCRMVTECGQGNIWASDHYPIISTIHMT